MTSKIPALLIFCTTFSVGFFINLASRTPGTDRPGNLTNQRRITTTYSNTSGQAAAKAELDQLNLPEFPTATEFQELFDQVIGVYSPPQIIAICRSHQERLMLDGRWQDALRFAMSLPFLSINGVEASLFDEILNKSIINGPKLAADLILKESGAEGNLGYWRKCLEAMARIDPDAAADYIRSFQIERSSESKALYAAALISITEKKSSLTHDDLSILAGRQPDAREAIFQLGAAFGSVAPQKAKEWAASSSSPILKEAILTAMLEGAAGYSRNDFPDLLDEFRTLEGSWTAVEIWGYNLWGARGAEGAAEIGRITDVELRQLAEKSFLKAQQQNAK